MRKMKYYFNGLSIVMMVSVILLAACSHGAGPTVDQIDLEGVKNHLWANEADPYLEFTFDQAVASAGQSSWTTDWAVTVSGSTVKASYTKPLTVGEPLSFSLTVSPSGDGDTRSFPGEYVPVDGAFSRASLSASADQSGDPPQYGIAYYDHTSATVALVDKDDDTIWVALDRQADAEIIGVFNAVWTPNSAGGGADVEEGKSAVVYDKAISDAVHALFSVAISGNGTGDKIYIKGTALPGNNNEAYNADNLIVIHIGLPDADNSGLPTFYIPHQGLGDLEEEDSGDYSHIRLRVNSGAHLVLLADNSAYEAADGDKIAGAGHPCEPGYFKGGCVEVMAGGKLRDGAWEGFPLGTDAVILNRYNSYLAVGAESYKNVDTLTYSGSDGPQVWYAGWLVGPSSGSPRIEWDDGNDPDAYLEVRPGELATDAKLTAKKSVALIYSAWFVGDAHLTVDAGSETVPVFTAGTQSIHGIIANETSSQSFDFYGSDKSRVGTASAFITVKSGNFIDGRFLTTTPSTETASSLIFTSGGDIYIGFVSAPSGDATEYGTDTGISGWLVGTISTGGGGS